MSYNIKRVKNTVTINVNNIGDRKEKLLEGFNNCKEGSCECPTNEYSKLNNLEIRNDPDEITLILTVKDKEILDEDEISACVDYSIKKAET